MARGGGTIRIGTSGYQYTHWRNVFYPAEVPKSGWFEYYAERFDTVEINNTFYQLPPAQTFDNWKKRAPEDFCYAVKLNRYITHRKKLKAPKAALGKFLRRAERLRGTLGPILVQLPPNWDVNEDRLAKFLEAAPRKHRWCVEFRDRRWLTDAVLALLRKHGAALCVHDMIENHPQELTASWTYLRFHGKSYGGSYQPEFLRGVAKRLQGYSHKGFDVYVYFNNDQGGHAAANARDLKKCVEGAQD